VDVPLWRGDDHTAPWRDANLLFSQTCGYPFTHALAGRVTLVATPHYAADGCEGANYSSIVFARDWAPLEEFRGATAAVNNPDSMSGMLALKLVFQSLAIDGRFFGHALESGGHIRSMIAVRSGKADVCAVDAVCAAMARAYCPDYLDGLVEIARSPLVPGLPFITSAGDPATIRAALSNAFADPDLQETRDHLFLSGFSALPPQDYRRIVDLEASMEAKGGLKLL
jgi:ABC-type phosphate/phosphonate transport system substrate-binding protein